MSNIQVVNLADNINAAILKINQNFSEIDLSKLSEDEINALIQAALDGFTGGTDSGDVTNIVNNILDSDYFLSVINQEYLQQFTINTSVDLTDVEAGISANASSIFDIQASITQTDSGITVLAQQIQATQAQLEGITLDGIDSDLLADAIANANTTLISRIDATDSSISVFAANIDSVNASLLLLDSATQDRIDVNANAISTLSTSVTANTNGISAIASDVTDLEVSLQQIITDGIELTPEQVTEAIGGALEELTTRIDADSDSLAVESQKLVDLEASLATLDSDTGVAQTANADATATLTARVEVNEGSITSISEDIVDLENAVTIVNPATNTAIEAEATARALLTSRVTATEGSITSFTQDIVDIQNDLDITNSDGTLSTAIAGATTDLQAEITAVDGRITSTNASLTDTLNTKIDDDIAAASSSLQSQIDGLGGTTASWTIDLVAGTEADPHVAGIKFGNDGDTADFAITADSFKVINASDNAIQPFTVSGDEVQLSNATVTGQLDIGTSQTGSRMEITNDLISIFEQSNIRVKLGNLS